MRADLRMALYVFVKEGLKLSKMNTKVPEIERKAKEVLSSTGMFKLSVTDAEISELILGSAGRIAVENRYEFAQGVYVTLCYLLGFSRSEIPKEINSLLREIMEEGRKESEWIS